MYKQSMKWVLVIISLVMAPQFAAAEETQPQSAVTLDSCGQIAGLSPDVLELIEQQRGCCFMAWRCVRMFQRGACPVLRRGRSVRRAGAGLTILGSRT